MSKKRRPRTSGKAALTGRERSTIDRCVKHFVTNEHLFQRAADSVMSACTINPHLKQYIHFIKCRVKDPEHLRAKLRLNAIEAKASGRAPVVDVENLFEQVNDLAGVRILHLHTDEMENINKHIVAILDEEKYRLIGKPVAHVWDDEYHRYFSELGLTTVMRETMYASVHYVIELNTASRVRCELQVRTLADELWGEVSHKVDYSEPTESVACKEQLKVLARVTSGCTRLVDSIFRSQDEFDKMRSQLSAKNRRGKPPSKRRSVQSA